jgi:hypothetical protein
MSAGVKRAMNLALGHFIAKRLGIPRPVQAAELTAIRSAVEDHMEERLIGVTAVDVEGGWTADESLEQHGLRVAMDMMLEGVQPPADVAPTKPVPDQGHSVVCDDNINPVAKMKFAARFAMTAATLLVCLHFGHDAIAANIDAIDGQIEGEKYVSIEGQLVAGDLEKVKHAAKIASQSGTNSLTFLLNSMGGDLAVAMQIGRFARELMASTRVEGHFIYARGTSDGDFWEEMTKKYPHEGYFHRTVRKGESPKKQQLVRCFSACVLLFYGGVSRSVNDNIDISDGKTAKRIHPVIGVHRPYYSMESYASLSPADAQKSYSQLDRIVREYLREMGAPPPVVDRMFRKASNAIDLIPKEEFEGYFQPKEPFFEEWQIARCGPYGAATALNEGELRDYVEYREARKRAIASQSIKSSVDFHQFSTSATAVGRFAALEKKVSTIDGWKLACRERELKQYQADWLNKN